MRHRLGKLQVMLAGLLIAPLAVAQEALPGMPEWLILLTDAFPSLGVIIAAGAVLIAAPIVRSATEWVKVRLQHRMGDVPNWVNHAVNATLSIVLTVVFLTDGRWGDDPVLGGLAWPWNAVIFAALVFLRAGGWWDEKQSENLTEAGVDPIAYRTAPDGETKAALLSAAKEGKAERGRVS